MNYLMTHPEFCLDLLRIYLGLGLFMKGVNFIIEPKLLTEWMSISQLLATKTLLAHYVIITHFCGGILLILGLVTRIAALVQLPVLAGAVFFVHYQEGLFTSTQNLEFTILVTFLLAIFSLVGGGPLSLDKTILKK